MLNSCLNLRVSRIFQLLSFFKKVLIDPPSKKLNFPIFRFWVKEITKESKEGHKRPSRDQKNAQKPKKPKNSIFQNFQIFCEKNE